MTERLRPDYGRRLRELERRLERLERGRGADSYDVTGNLLAGDDAVSGQGLARPYLPVPFVMSSATDVTTSSGAFTDVLVNTAYYKQHPRIVVVLFVGRSVADTTGEVQLVDDAGGLVAGPVATGAAAWVTLGPAAVPGAHLSVRTLRVQARRTAGTGTVNVRAAAVAYGLES